MTQPTLNEYFTLTNDLLFKLIVSSVPHSMNKDVESTMVFSIDSETMNSADSIGVGLQVGDFMTGRSNGHRLAVGASPDKGSGQRAAWRTIPRHERNRGRAAGRRRFLCPRIPDHGKPGKHRGLCTYRISDCLRRLKTSSQWVVIPLPPEDESFTPPLCQEDQGSWFIKEARPHTQSPIIKALFKMDPIFEVMQRNLDRLSDQKQICEVMKKRYLRMQEVIQEEEKAAMRA